MLTAVGMDVGGGSTKFAVVGNHGDILAAERVPTPVDAAADDLVEAYAGAIESVIAKSDAGRPAGIGVGVPGHVDQAGRVTFNGNVPALDNYPLVDFLEHRFKIAARLDNDATTAALAEHRFGAGRKANRLLIVTVGTGIGVGMVCDGQPQRPVRGCMGDPGHIIVDPQGRWSCRLGCRGCLESVASSLALERQAAAADWKTDSRLGAESGGAADTFAIIEAARNEDAIAIGLLRELAGWLGRAVVSWVYLYDPDVILFGGGVSASGEMLVSSIQKTMRDVGMSAYLDGVDIGLAKLGNEAGVIGAASLFLDPAEEISS